MNKNPRQENYRLIHILLYILLAFLLPALLKQIGWFFHNINLWNLYFIMEQIVPLAPSLAALLLVTCIGGWRGMLEFLRKLFIRNIKVRYIVLAILIPIVMLGVAKFISINLVGNKTNIDVSILGQRSPSLIVLAMLACEVGWRGFLQDEISKKYGYIVTPFLVGLIWAIWYDVFSFKLDIFIPTGIISTIRCIAESYGYYWITIKSKGNIIPATLWHFFVYLFSAQYLIDFDNYFGNKLPYQIYVLFTVIMAIIIVVYEFNTLENKVIRNSE